MDETYNQWMAEQWFDHVSTAGVVGDQDQAVFTADKNEPTMGYVTRDSCPGKGDDIEHVPGMCIFLLLVTLMIQVPHHGSQP